MVREEALELLSRLLTEVDEELEALNKRFASLDSRLQEIENENDDE